MVKHVLQGLTGAARANGDAAPRFDERFEETNLYVVGAKIEREEIGRWIEKTTAFDADGAVQLPRIYQRVVAAEHNG